MSFLRLHFFGHDPTQKSIPLAAALGVGSQAESLGADTRRFERLAAKAPQRWQATNEQDSDLFVYHHPYEECPGALEGARRARELGKPCLFFHSFDDTSPTAPPYGQVYRESMLASLQREHEHPMPAFADDLARETGGFQPLDKRELPSVGFCGYVGSSLNRFLYRAQGRQRKVLGLDLRNQALKRLESSKRVVCQFVKRAQFWGGAISRFKGPDPEAKQRVRAEYLENLSTSDYTLCLRGAGNFSFRFYETLAMGRIPLFVNTDCRLPFDDQIDWQRHVVWIEQDELPHIGERLAEFHSRLTDEAFQQLQRDNRQLWEEHLRPTEAYQQVLQRVIASHRNQETG